MPALSMCLALSACSGSSAEQAADDLDEYCASVENADEVCDDTSAKPAAPARDTEPTGNFNPFCGSTTDPSSSSLGACG